MACLWGQLTGTVGLILRLPRMARIRTDLGKLHLYSCFVKIRANSHACVG